jgi:hypothetical protein
METERIALSQREMLRTYIATGVWDWLGGLGNAAAMVVPGTGMHDSATS